MPFPTFLEEAARHTTLAANSLASARHWLDQSKQHEPSSLKRRACLTTARKCLTHADSYAEIAQLALISHRTESLPTRGPSHVK